MALSLDDLTAKVDNGGVTPDGLLTAEEYNALLAAVKENAENSTDEHIGSVVVENTLSALDETSNKPVDSKGIAKAIETATNNIVAVEDMKEAIAPFEAVITTKEQVLKAKDRESGYYYVGSTSINPDANSNLYRYAPIAIKAGVPIYIKSAYPKGSAILYQDGTIVRMGTASGVSNWTITPSQDGMLYISSYVQYDAMLFVNSDGSDIPTSYVEGVYDVAINESVKVGNTPLKDVVDEQIKQTTYLNKERYITPRSNSFNKVMRTYLNVGIDSAGNIIPKTGYVFGGIIPVFEGETYYRQKQGGEVAFYDSNLDIVGIVDASDTAREHIVPKGASYIAVCSWVIDAPLALILKDDAPFSLAGVNAKLPYFDYCTNIKSTKEHIIPSKLVMPNAFITSAGVATKDSTYNVYKVYVGGEARTIITNALILGNASVVAFDKDDNIVEIETSIVKREPWILTTTEEVEYVLVSADIANGEPSFVSLNGALNKQPQISVVESGLKVILDFVKRGTLSFKFKPNYDLFTNEALTRREYIYKNIPFFKDFYSFALTRTNTLNPLVGVDAWKNEYITYYQPNRQGSIIAVNAFGNSDTISATNLNLLSGFGAGDDAFSIRMVAPTEADLGKILFINPNGAKLIDRVYSTTTEWVDTTILDLPTTEGESLDSYITRLEQALGDEYTVTRYNSSGKSVADIGCFCARLARKMYKYSSEVYTAHELIDPTGADEESNWVVVIDSSESFITLTTRGKEYKVDIVFDSKEGKSRMMTFLNGVLISGSKEYATEGDSYYTELVFPNAFDGEVYDIELSSDSIYPPYFYAFMGHYSQVGQEDSSSSPESMITTFGRYRRIYDYLINNGWTLITLKELRKYLRGQAIPPQKAAIFTYDDAPFNIYDDTEERAISNKYGVNSVLCYVLNDQQAEQYIDSYKSGYFEIYDDDSDDIKRKKGKLNARIVTLDRMDKADWGVVSHTVNHTRVRDLTYAQIMDMLSRTEELSKVFKLDIYALTYPANQTRAYYHKLLKNHGVEFAFGSNTMSAGMNYSAYGGQEMTIFRQDIQDAVSFDDIIDKIEQY